METRSDSHVTKNNPPGHRLTFRPDIQGLRALAILLVVAAHAKLEGFPGGFIGVDVFFVLSGYLITALLVEEIQSTEKMQFSRFYARRLRRLLPGLILMLLGVGVLSRLLLSASDQVWQSNSAMNAAGWISNIYFSLLDAGYFNPNQASNLYLHTWSLGVEEQFYLIWPLLVVLSMTGLTGKLMASSQRRLLWIFAIVGAGSLGACIYWSYNSPEFAFYMMPARGWQFALGAVVYLLFGITENADGKSHTEAKLHLPAWTGWFGVALVLGCSIFLSDNEVYPGLWALIPAFGAALIITAGVNRPDTRLSRILSLRQMQWIGNISYSWYLWHWPILLFGTYTLGYGTPTDRLVLVLISLAIAAASHRFVESPMRHARWTLNRPRLTLALSSTAVIFMVLLTHTWNQSAKAATAKVKTPAMEAINKARHAEPILYSENCDSFYHSSAIKPCIFGDPKASHTAVLIGDSIGAQWTPALRNIFKDMHWRFIVITKGSCPMVDENFYYARIKRYYVNCFVWRKSAFKKLRNYKPDIAILGSTSMYPFSKKEWIEGTHSLLLISSKAAHRVIVLRSTPTLPFNGPDCLSVNTMLFRWLSKYPDCSAPAHDKKFDEIFAWREKAGASFRNVTYVDMTSLVCPHDTCRAQYKGHIVFRDEKHLTANFARSLAPQLAAVMNLSSPVSNASNHQTSSHLRR